MVERHHARRKIVVRERIDMLVDPLSPVLELCPLAAWGMHDERGSGGRVGDRRWASCTARFA